MVFEQRPEEEAASYGAISKKSVSDRGNHSAKALWRQSFACSRDINGGECTESREGGEDKREVRVRALALPKLN